MWSSRAESAATSRRSPIRAAADDPTRAGLWCPGEHDPLRVSGYRECSRARSAARSQQPFRDGAVVREFQPAQWGWTPHRAARGASADGPEPAFDGRGLDGRARGRAGALRRDCIFEVFGEALRPPGGTTAAVGIGVHPFRDPAITDEFSARGCDRRQWVPRLCADWRPGRVDFLIDGQHVKSVDQA